MTTDITLQTYPIFIGLGLSVISLVVWIVHRRIKREWIKQEERTDKYTKKQKLGIFVILFLILPFMLNTMSYLARGVLFMWIIPINILSEVPALHLPLQTFAIAVICFLYFAGIYFICEYLWPTKQKGNEENLFM